MINSIPAATGLKTFSICTVSTACRWSMCNTSIGYFTNVIVRVLSCRLTESAIVENGEVINPDAKYPRLDENDFFSATYSSFYVEDGSYLRLRNLRAGYSVPPEVLPGHLRIFLQGENLFTITGYSGLDSSKPSANVSKQGREIRDQAMGIDRGVYPRSQTLTLGINATF